MEAKEMKTAWMVGAAMAMAAQAGPRKPQADALVTVFTYDRVGVPEAIMARAKQVATSAFGAAGIEVKWADSKRPGERREVAAGEVLTMVFDGAAPASFPPPSVAFTNLSGGADANVHVFYYRVADVVDMRAQRSTGVRLPMAEFLGNVLAHELTHALEGVARHSSEGLMKAFWSASDFDGMARGPLAFAAEDLELLRSHFRKETSPAPALVATW
jgi:hypothetical protein